MVTWPFNVTWAVLGFLTLKDACQMRLAQRAVADLVSTSYVDILVEAAAQSWAAPGDGDGACDECADQVRRSVLRSGAFSSPYGDPRRRGAAGEAHLCAVLQAFGRSECPPPNIAGIVALLVPETNVLFVPPTMPFGQQLLHWWDAAAKRAHGGGGDCVVQRISNGGISDPRGASSAAGWDAALRGARPAAPSLQGPTGLSMAAVLHREMEQNLPSRSAPLNPLIGYQAFGQSDADATGDFGPVTDEQMLDIRRRELALFARVTRCVFYRATGLFSRRNRGEVAAVDALVAKLLPSAPRALRTALRVAGCTAVCRPTNLGPPDPDYYNVVPFNLSWHQFPSLDLTAFALEAPPIRIIGMRVMRGATLASATSTVCTAVQVTGDLTRPETVFAKIARSWFSHPVNTSNARTIGALTVMDLTGVGRGFSRLQKDTFTFTLMPSLEQLFLPLHFEAFEESSIVDLPLLKRVVVGDAASFVPLYRDSTKTPVRCGLDLSVSTALTTIQSQNFRRCNSIQSVAMPASLSLLGDAVLSRSDQLRTVDLSRCMLLQEIGPQFATWDPNLSQVLLPPTIAAFRFSAFRGCPRMRECVGLDNLISPHIVVGKNAFRGTGLECMRAPNGLARLESDAFAECAKLTFVDLSAAHALQSIGAGAMSDCPSLRTVRFPRALTEVGAGAFARCNISAVDLDHTALRIINDGAFHSNESLKSLRVPPTLLRVGADAFSRCNALLIVDLSMCDRLSVDDAAFSYCDLLHELRVASSATIGRDVAAHAFERFHLVRPRQQESDTATDTPCCVAV
jgi:hypothetical protein